MIVGKVNNKHLCNTPTTREKEYFNMLKKKTTRNGDVFIGAILAIISIQM
jgi:hypothetical protein